MVLTLAAETVLDVWGDKLKMNALKNAFHIATVYPSVSQNSALWQILSGFRISFFKVYLFCKPHLTSSIPLLPLG